MSTGPAGGPGALAAPRRSQLSSTLAWATEQSPFHQDRLAGLDLDAVRPDDLTALPPMTKAELMAHWDDVVTDRDLTLTLARDREALRGVLPAIDESETQARLRRVRDGRVHPHGSETLVVVGQVGILSERIGALEAIAAVDERRLDERCARFRVSGAGDVVLAY